MTRITQLHSRLIDSFGIKDFDIPASYVKFFFKGDDIPEKVQQYHIEEESIMCCQAARHAAQGHPVLLSVANIGCVAAAISLGLVSAVQESPLSPESRVYTDIMKKQSGKGRDFMPPSPKDFTQGAVYACKDAKRPDFSLFGEKDSGRYKDIETAQKAVSEMAALQPPQTKAVFVYGTSFDELDILPDVVVLSVRPVELARLIQGYQFETGKRVKADMGGLRAVDSDLIVRPYLTGEINVATYCLGARLVARYEADRMGMGVPFTQYELLIKGLEKSQTGYPFPRYPGANGKK
ncbi:DUF169 domain-containing protein [Dethiosulfatarculus sandiegensis]|uniref:DUF169 domain-containing protein n=1 Tax=Dethiosulfatarculus sandiegensis TaxID=1429043 RepID=A0A0D2J0T0_9BACT|nr:DUF169 domain-containing protein [Dethiosulfatarculus sandiegensis]KIX11859.1 hypothetical protein X474_22090 [Dethiosulfatarculus sandiegensis]